MYALYTPRRLHRRVKNAPAVFSRRHRVAYVLYCAEQRNSQIYHRLRLASLPPISSLSALSFLGPGDRFLEVFLAGEDRLGSRGSWVWTLCSKQAEAYEILKSTVDRMPLAHTDFSLSTVSLLARIRQQFPRDVFSRYRSPWVSWKLSLNSMFKVDRNLRNSAIYHGLDRLTWLQSISGFLAFQAKILCMYLVSDDRRGSLERSVWTVCVGVLWIWQWMISKWSRMRQFRINMIGNCFSVV